MGRQLCGFCTSEPRQQRQYRSARRTHDGPQVERACLRMVRATAHVKPQSVGVSEQASCFARDAQTVPHRLRTNRARRLNRLRRTQRVFATRLRQGWACRRKRKWRYRRQVPRSLNDCHPESFGSRCRLWRSRLERPRIAQRNKASQVHEQPGNRALQQARYSLRAEPQPKRHHEGKCGHYRRRIF